MGLLHIAMGGKRQGGVPSLSKMGLPNSANAALNPGLRSEGNVVRSLSDSRVVLVLDESDLIVGCPPRGANGLFDEHQ